MKTCITSDHLRLIPSRRPWWPRRRRPRTRQGSCRGPLVRGGWGTHLRMVRFVWGAFRFLDLRRVNFEKIEVRAHEPKNTLNKKNLLFCSADLTEWQSFLGRRIYLFEVRRGDRSGLEWGIHNFHNLTRWDVWWVHLGAGAIGEDVGGTISRKKLLWFLSRPDGEPTYQLAGGIMCDTPAWWRKSTLLRRIFSKRHK